MSGSAVGSVPLQVGWHLENSGELVRDSVVAFFATAATTAESSVVQEKALRKIRPRIHFLSMVITLLIAESQPQEKNVLTRVLVNLINRRNM